MNLRFVIGVVVLTSLVACGAPAPTTGNLDSPSVVSASESTALCLAPVTGSDTIDRTLVGTQLSAQRDAGQAAPWVAVGNAWVRKARISADPGFYLNVDACASAALAIDHDDSNALALRSVVLMNAHRFEAAMQVAAQILATSPDHALALGILSDAQLELGDYAQALHAAQRLMSANPGMAADARGSWLAFLHGDNARAKLLIRDALYGRSGADPEAAAWTFVEAARLYWNVGDYSGADALLVEATNWVKDYPAALTLRARIALAQDAPEHAITFARHAHRVHPTIETAWLISDAYRLIGDTSNSQVWFTRAHRLGEQADALTLSLMLATRDREPQLALAAIERERGTRGGIYVDDTYAWALYRNGRLHEARQHSDSALRLGTKDARLLFHAGAIRFALGENAQARTLIERALALNPKFDPFESQFARELLSTLPRPERGGGGGAFGALSR